jgi:response regulator RpfG family c-di-GMP phosphodiesterase
MTNANDVWHVLVVDDEPDMLAVTRMALEDYEFAGRRVVVYDAHNAEECKRQLNAVPDIAVVLLDVVMEQDDTGFQLVRYIREELDNQLVRIIIRTGQPGKAPLLEAVSRYDINDYKEKTELTIDKLRVTLMTALRSWNQMRETARSHAILHHLVERNPALFQSNTVKQFSGTVIDQLLPFLNLWAAGETHDIVFAVDKGDGTLDVMEGRGVFATRSDGAGKLTPALAREILATNYIRRHDGGMTLSMGSSLGTKGYLHVRGIPTMDDWTANLLRMFVNSITSAFENLELRRDSDATQREIILNLGELMEARSGETVYHVHRVAGITRLLAEWSGVARDELELVGLAAAFHDVGKIVIPESILNKPGSLTPDEFNVIKQHARIGREILSKSARPLFRVAAVMAGQHHERFDGTGYPDGVHGKDIHPYGRMLAIADVYDALSHDRVYKKAWPEDQVLEYLMAQKGKHFDPDLLDLFFERYDKIQALVNTQWH